MNPVLLMDHSIFVLNTRGPLAAMPAMDVMWVSFYSIALMLVAVLIVSAVRKWIHNGVLSFIFRMVAFGLFLIGTILMVLVVATWPA
ncbi:DUF2768 domain-containing protein [Lysinibacillus odysseyi]|nr:DUF2768 domain-containing protein [Lysinibacillus odysseyi]